MSLASVEELQNLAGGADIKGDTLHHSYAMHIVKPGLEAVLDRAVHLEDGEKIVRGIDLESMNIKQRDALLLFCTLFKGLLEGISHSFTKNFHFIDSVKAYLSYALLRASVLNRWESLKGEIGILFPLIVLRSLDSSECSLNQKISYHSIETMGINMLILTQLLYTRWDLLVCLFAQLSGDVLKSLFDWEKMRRELENPSYGKHPIDGEVSSGEFDESTIREDLHNNLEKAKAHKSTMDAVIAEAMIGDYLGQHEEFPFALMHAYVDSMKFSSMKFESAICEFLRGFRRAQKIDRIVEKFVEQ
ncbi:hypothetical protein RHSIM_Rhsim05G0125500 [Rhododendron simsii]|uniref:SEC7 domain-containing protein n=1 Tax=Rhododendron simsii TaxID=118357 RepID=A0A834LPD9_RHOSS|nr:hypothetical protein RHSIM_Rhsim05G0125500 [Rhododendron simsii]